MAVMRNVVVRIGADISQLARAMEQAQSTMQRAGKTLSHIGDAMFKGITLPIAGLGAASIKTAADFEESMSKIKAVSGAGSEEMAQLKKLAMDMGAETKFSAKEAASGIEELIKAGVTTEQILGGGLKGALSLASAGELELAEAAEIASTALNAFKKDNLSVAQAADVLAGAANASATDVRELKFGLSMVSAVASGVGLSFKDTSTALAVFAQNGLKGSDAGTSLKTMLLNLQPTTKQQIEAFTRLGMVNEKGQSIFYTTEGRLKSMAEIANILKTKMSQLTDAQRQQSLEMMFGTDAIRAANILYNEGAAGINNMKQEMGKVTAEEVAAEKTNNLKGAIEQLKGSLETAGISIGEKFIPYLKSFAEGIKSMTDGFMALDPSTQNMIIKMGLLAAGIGATIAVLGKVISFVAPLMPIISSIASGIGTLIFAFSAWAGGAATLAEALLYLGGPFALIVRFGTLIASVAGTVSFAFAAWMGGAATLGEALLLLVGGPIGAIILGIIAVAAAAYLIYKNWDGIKEFFIKLWDSVKSTTLTVWDAIINFFSVTVPEAFRKVILFFSELPGKISSYFIDLFVYKIPYAVGYGIGWVLKYLTENIPKVIQFFKELPGKIWTWLTETYNKLTTWGLNMATKAVEIGGKIVSSIVDFVKTLPTKIDYFLTEVLPKMTEFASNAYNKAKEIGRSIYNGIVDVVKSIPDEVMRIINGAISWVSDKITSIKNTISNAFSSFTSGISAGMSKSTYNPPSIQKHAEGGIFTKPTLFGNHLFGEAGPEALLPLNKLDGMLNQQTQTGTNIVQVILDGKVIQEYIDNGLGRKLSTLGAI